MKIVSLFVGMPASVQSPSGTVVTAGRKSPVESAFLRFDGFEGDGQGNRKFHGGRDRTVCLYVAEHYAWWKAAYGYELRDGAFCENITVEGAQEAGVCIGDVFQAGKAVVQVSLVRDPCRTLDLLTGITNLWIQARASGKLGFHLRTLEQGLVRAGDSFELLRAHPERITVAEVLDLYHGRSRSQALARRLAQMPEFAEQGKRDIAERLSRADPAAPAP